MELMLIFSTGKFQNNNLLKTIYLYNNLNHKTKSGSFMIILNKNIFKVIELGLKDNIMLIMSNFIQKETIS
jgi:hypothetical protein